MPTNNLFKRLFSGLSRFLRKLFARARVLAETVIPVGIDVVENLKLLLDSPITPLITTLIPGQVDDVIAEKIREALPKILLNLKIADECTKMQSNDAIIQCAIKHLKAYHPTARKAYYLNIASMLSEALADGKLTWSEIVLLTQYTYDNRLNK